MLSNELDSGYNEEFQFTDNLDRSVFHRCCLEQNPRILKLNLNKIK
jgi:hypothetical protein